MAVSDAVVVGDGEIHGVVALLCERELAFVARTQGGVCCARVEVGVGGDWVGAGWVGEEGGEGGHGGEGVDEMHFCWLVGWLVALFQG